MPSILSKELFLKYTGNGGQSITANVTNITFSTVVTDSYSAWNGTQFTAPFSGWFRVKGSIAANTSTSAFYSAYVDGTVKELMNLNATTDVKSCIWAGYLAAGQVLSFRSDSGMTLTNNSNTHWISIEGRSL